MRDYVGIALRYAKRAADPKNAHSFNLWTRLYAARFLRRHAAAKRKGNAYTFSDWHACDACDFIEKLPHVEGRWDTPDIVLCDAHVCFVVQLFGFRRGAYRLTTKALWASARKNAKSTIAAGIALYCQVCEDEEGPQIYSAATTYVQAAIVWTVAKRMVERTADLREAFGLNAFAKAISSRSNGGTFKALHAKASTQDGLNPSCTIVDEVHAHKSPDLINVLESAAGMRDQALFLFVTTEGYEGGDTPWSDLRTYTHQVLQDVIEADHFLCVIYAVDEENKTYGVKADEDFDERAWIKANPLFESAPKLLADMRKQAADAKAMPTKHAEFKTKKLNRAASVSGGHINLVQWRLCSSPVDLEALREYPCHGGLDLASTSDLCAFRLRWLVGDVIYTHGWRFVPPARVRAVTQRGLVPYSGWVQSGKLIECGDEVIDYARVEQCIEDAAARFNLRGVGYDPWNATQSAMRLRDKGINMLEMRQGPQSYHPAMKAIDEAYSTGKVAHGGDPVLAWCASNLVARLDVNLNMAPSRKASTGKIDDMCALYMATWCALNDAGTGVDKWLQNAIVTK